MSATYKTCLRPNRRGVAVLAVNSFRRYIKPPVWPAAVAYIGRRRCPTRLGERYMTRLPSTKDSLSTHMNFDRTPRYLCCLRNVPGGSASSGARGHLTVGDSRYAPLPPLRL